MNLKIFYLMAIILVVILWILLFAMNNTKNSNGNDNITNNADIPEEPKIKYKIMANSEVKVQVSNNAEEYSFFMITGEAYQK